MNIRKINRKSKGYNRTRCRRNRVYEQPIGVQEIKRLLELPIRHYGSRVRISIEEGTVVAASTWF